MKSFLATIAAVVLVTPSAVAGGGGSVTLLDHGGPTRYGSIAEAIDAAKAGDTLYLADGVYTGPENTDLVVDFPIDIIGRGPKVCVIDCKESSRAFWFQSNVRLEGMTIRNGVAMDGGAVLANGPFSRFFNVKFVNNTADAYGGAVYVTAGYAVFQGCRFEDNEALFGGGAAISEQVFGGAYADATSCAFIGNRAEAGGGMWVAGSLLLEDPFTNLVQCVFEANEADIFGGGLAAEFADDILIDRCIFRSNVCAGNGGGIAFNGDISPFSDSLTIRNSWVVDNTAAEAGGILAGLCGALIQWSTVANNVSTDAAPGGLAWVFGPGVLSLNSIFWGNESPAADAFSDQITITAGVNNSLGSNIQGLAPMGSNISADPLFVNAAAGDYHILPMSPCVDAGVDNGVGVTMIDIDGHSRFEGSGFDIGADEVQQ